ncbi:hypothetical protein L7F22_061502 [Adiantum nelumboides]|nr:hypothetical protein [Adiantum nelumboides]
MSLLSSTKRLVPWKLPASRRCLIIASLQIAFLLAYLALHLFFLSRTSLQRLSSWEVASARVSSFCPDIHLSRETSAESSPWVLQRNLSLPQNQLSNTLLRHNALPPRNLDLFPNLLVDHLVIVLYVHNRPAYLKVAVQGLSRVIGISEALLIISHDGFFPEMNAIVEGIRFCQVKQIFAPFSPHIFPHAFPGVSSNDCVKKDDQNCKGDPDQYGNYRAPHIVSLKHHWWWMMNTVWDGLPETRNYHDHILFIEEDHFLFPNALLNIRTLSALKACACPACYMANLAPADVNFKGERTEILVADKIGNMGYAFNRTIWKKIHMYAEQFCNFDDYNWDITMWVAVYPEWGSATYSLRGPRQSALHFGKCGLHQGKREGQPPCFDEGGQLPPVEEEDKVYNINPNWVVRHSFIKGYDRGFKGWGGWSDTRDKNLCLDFASMYQIGVII